MVLNEVEASDSIICYGHLLEVYILEQDWLYPEENVVELVY